MYIRTDAAGNVTEFYRGVKPVGEAEEVSDIDGEVITESGVPLYKLENGVLVKRSAQEVEKEEVDKEATKMPTQEERLAACEDLLMEMLGGGVGA